MRAGFDRSHMGFWVISPREVGMGSKNRLATAFSRITPVKRRTISESPIGTSLHEPKSVGLNPSRRTKGIELLRKLFELGDAHLPIREHGSNFQPAPKRFDVFCERAEVNVGAVLDLGHFALIYS